VQEIDINKYVTFGKEDAWISYQLDRCKILTDDTTSAPAYCYAEHGVFCIFIAKDYIVKGGKVLVELLKHELAHGYFGHLRYMKGREKHKQLLNVLFDCSIHVNAADATTLSTLGDICTYDSVKLPILPPLVLYEKLKKEMDNKTLDMFLDNNLSDVLWKQKAISELENQVIHRTMDEGIREAERDGHVAPDSYGSGPGTGSNLGTDIDVLKEATPDWIHQLKKFLLNSIAKHKSPSWHREARNLTHPDILKRGYAPSTSKGRCLFAIDCSWSMNPRYVSQAVSVLLHCTEHEDIEGSAVFFDSKVSKRVSLRNKAEIITLAQERGGGTSLQPVIDYARPDDLVVFYTDGWFDRCDSSRLQRPPICVITPNGTTSTVERSMPDWKIIQIENETDWTEPV